MFNKITVNEQFSSEKRTKFNAVINVGKVIGILLSSVISYWLKDWRLITVRFSKYCILILLKFQ